jgi:UDP-N-acetylmuramoyl-tripeptide--D-alanyl-D-alanine ligase
VIDLTLAEIAAVVGGTLSPEASQVAEPTGTVTGKVTTDSRVVEPGDLFVALAGERVDGHDFAAAAIQDGAVAVLASRPVGVPAIVLDDPLVALGLLARRVVTALPQLTVVGVTGSSGKTSTKDMLAALLSRLGPTVAPPGSHNNELGAPLSALRAVPATRFLVAEFGARGIGHIAYLAGLVPPRIGVVLNVGTAHLGEFGDRETTARAKGELVEALPASGVAILNADDPAVRAMAGRTSARVVLFGESSDAHVRAQDVALDAEARASFTLVHGGEQAEVILALHGEHQVSNALAVAAVALEAGMPLRAVADGLGEVRPMSRWRMEVTTRPDGITVVNDAYNANPDSVRAALKALAAMGRPSGAPPRRTWAVLGEMGELGAESREQHDAIGRLVVRLDISRLVAVGDGAVMIHQGAAQEGSWNEESVWVPDQAAALDLLHRDLAVGDVVLVKASRFVGLDRLASQLLIDPMESSEAAR